MKNTKNFPILLALVTLLACSAEDDFTEVPVFRGLSSQSDTETTDPEDQCIDEALSELLEQGLEGSLPEVILVDCPMARSLSSFSCGSRQSPVHKYMNLFPGYNLPNDEFACCLMSEGQKKTCKSTPCKGTCP